MVIANGNIKLLENISKWAKKNYFILFQSFSYLVFVQNLQFAVSDVITYFKRVVPEFDKTIVCWYLMRIFFSTFFVAFFLLLRAKVIWPGIAAGYLFAKPAGVPGTVDYNYFILRKYGLKFSLYNRFIYFLLTSLNTVKRFWSNYSQPAFSKWVISAMFWVLKTDQKKKSADYFLF